MRQVEIAVVGGGPAGAATAYGLAAAGREVVLLERSAGSHHKVCGEFLSPETLTYLARVGVDPSALGAASIDYAAISSPQGRGVFRLPFRALSLSRYRLDQALLEQAVEAGVETRRGVIVQSAEPIPSGWQLRCNDGVDFCCRRLVLATGKWPLRGIVDRRDASMVGLKMHVKLPATQMRALAGCVELFLLDRGYVGLEAIEDGIANICLILPRTKIARLGRGWSGLLDFFAVAAPVLAERLSFGTDLLGKPVAVVCPAGGYFWGAGSELGSGLYPVGDRLAHIPPFAGDGLAIALSSAAIAVRHILRGSSSSAYMAHARVRIARAVQVAAVVSRLTDSGIGRSALVRAAVHAPALLNVVARLTRISRHGSGRTRPAGLDD